MYPTEQVSQHKEQHKADGRETYRIIALLTRAVGHAMKAGNVVAKPVKVSGYN